MADLIKIFNKQVKSKSFKKAYKPDTFKIKPSMIGSKCLRKAFYACTETPEDYPMPIGVQRICRLGDAVGDMLSEQFREAGVLIDYHNEDGSIPKMFGSHNFEFPIEEPDLYIKKGYIDGVFNIDGKLWLGEFKSINSNGYKYLNGPKEMHYYQGIIYYYVFNKLLQEGRYAHIKELEGFEKAEGIVFLYYNKDTSTMKQFPVSQNDPFFQHVIERIMALKKFKEANELPPGTEDFCKSCNWRDKCAKNQLK